MAKSNRELIRYYREKHELEPVLFSEKKDNEEVSLDSIVVPLKLDLRQFCSPSDDQGDTSHCAAYSAAQIIEAKYWKETGKLVQLDASHIYAKAKEIDGVTDSNGTYPEVTLKVALDLAKKLITDNIETSDPQEWISRRWIQNHRRLVFVEER